MWLICAAWPDPLGSDKGINPIGRRAWSAFSSSASISSATCSFQSRPSAIRGSSSRTRALTCSWRPGTAPLLPNARMLTVYIPSTRIRSPTFPASFSFARWRQAWQLVQDLRAQRYQLCLSLYGVPAATVSLLTGAPHRAGFADEAPPGSFSLPAAGSRLPQDRHEVHCALAVAQAAGVSATPDRMEAWVSATDRAWAQETLAAEGDALWVACGHGSRNGYAKRWPQRHWVALINQLQQAGYRAVLVGGPDELDAAASIAQACEKAPLVLTGKTTLGQLAAVLAQVTLMVGSDSGPLHLAVALGTRGRRSVRPHKSGALRAVRTA